MISASILGLGVKRKTLDIPVERVERVVGGNHGAVRRQKCEANDAAATGHKFGFGLWSDSNDTAIAANRRSHIEIADAIERKTLRASETAKKCPDFAGGINAIDGVETGSSRPGDEKFAGRAERQVIRGEGRLDGGEDKYFAVGSDFENRAAAIADVEAAAFVERKAGGDAHAFDPLHGAAVGRDEVHGAVVAAGNEEISVTIDGQAGGVHHFGDEGFYYVAGSDFVKRDGNFLAALAAEGDVDVSFRVHGRTGDGMQIVGNLRAERHGKWRAFDAAHAHADGSSRCTIGDARDQKIFGG